MIAGFTIFFNMVHVDHLKATSDEADIPVFITSEQTLVNEKSISEPVVARHMDSSAHVLLAKRVNPLPATATPEK